MRIALLFFILLASANAFAYDKRTMCSGAKQCLDLDVRDCSAADKKKVSRVKYDQKFCAPFLEIKKRGVLLDTEISKEMFSLLGQKYRAVYVTEGVLSVSPGMVGYLFDNMPFTAKLINAYQESSYSIKYTTPNRRVFSGSNGRSLSGDFIWVAQDSAKAKVGFRNVFFGVGRAKILKWHLHGTAVAFLDMDPVGKDKVRYKLTAIVFPGNTVLNSIMQMSAFKGIVEEKIDWIINDIQRASKRYIDGEREPILKSAELKTEIEKQHLKEFESVVRGAPWTLGDYFKKKGNDGLSR